MPRETLQSNLEQLRDELESTQQLDEATKQQLAEVADAIEQALEGSAPDRRSAQARAEAAALKFEAEHPRFSRILSEVTDALTKLGL